MVARFWFYFFPLFPLADITLFNVQDTRVLSINDVIWCEGNLWSYDLLIFWSVIWCTMVWGELVIWCDGNLCRKFREFNEENFKQELFKVGIVALFLNISFSSLSCPLQLLSLLTVVSHIVTIKSLMMLLALECCDTFVEAWILRVKG